jgi:hypothetical protein
LESFDDGIGPCHAGYDVTGCNPAGQAVLFEQSAQPVGDRAVKVCITDEDVSGHTVGCTKRKNDQCLIGCLRVAFVKA